MTGTPQTGRALHVDVALSNVAVNRRPEGFIADQFVPITPVTKQTDFFWKFNHLEFRRWEDRKTERAPGALPKKVAFSVSTDVYVARNYALGAEWTIEDEVNADEILQWAQTHTILLADQLMIDYEMRLATLAVDTSNVGTVTTIASAWTDPDNSVPFDNLNTHIENFRQRTGMRPNTMIIPEQVAVNLRRNAQLRDILFGQGGGLVTAQALAGLFNIPRVLIPYSQVNTSLEQETINGSGSLSDVWGPHVWIAHVRNLQGRNVDTWINAFRWTSPQFGVPFAIRRLPFDPRRMVQDIDAHYYQAEKVVSPDLAERIANVNG